MGNPCCLLHQQGLKEGKVVVETKVLGRPKPSTNSIIAHDYFKSIESPAGNTTKRRGMLPGWSKDETTRATTYQ